MYSFDHDIGSFVAIGTGTVSDDGQVINSTRCGVLSGLALRRESRGERDGG
jgi:hypothetical protein